MKFVVGRLLASFNKEQHQLTDLMGNQQFFVRWTCCWTIRNIQRTPPLTTIFRLAIMAAMFWMFYFCSTLWFVSITKNNLTKKPEGVYANSSALNPPPSRASIRNPHQNKGNSNQSPRYMPIIQRMLGVALYTTFNMHQVGLMLGTASLFCLHMFYLLLSRHDPSLYTGNTLCILRELLDLSK